MPINSLDHKNLTAAQYHTKAKKITLHLRKKRIKLSSYVETTLVYVYPDDLCFGVAQRKFNDHNVRIYRAYPDKIYDASVIKGYEIIVDDNVVERKSSNFGKIIAGGLLFGGLGAVAGAVDKGGKLKTSGKKSYSVRLILDDMEQASLDIKCDSSENAYRLLHTLALLEEKYSKQLNEQNNEQTTQEFKDTETSTVSFAEEIIKLKKLKDDGIITEEEFKVFKSKLMDNR
jgi:hypothetical protein